MKRDHGCSSWRASHTRTSTGPDSVGVCSTGSVAMHQSGHNLLSHALPNEALPGKIDKVKHVGSGTGLTWNGSSLAGQSVHIW